MIHHENGTSETVNEFVGPSEGLFWYAMFSKGIHLEQPTNNMVDMYNPKTGMRYEIKGLKHKEPPTSKNKKGAAKSTFEDFNLSNGNLKIDTSQYQLLATNYNDNGKNKKGILIFVYWKEIKKWSPNGFILLAMKFHYWKFDPMEMKIGTKGETMNSMYPIVEIADLTRTPFGIVRIKRDDELQEDDESIEDDIRLYSDEII